jgi:serine/threonine protein kinase
MLITEEDYNEMIDKIIGDYQLLEELGRGSYGCSFLGQSLTTNEYVAVKILSKKGLSSSELELQKLETDIQQHLNHINLLHLDHVIQEQDYTYMIMELCDGGDLFEYVVNNYTKDDEVKIKSIFSQILDAIEYLHDHEIYHRDIKLENILVQQDHIYKVADFGLATREKQSMDFGCGSATYLGPEHFSSDDEEEDEEEYEPYDTAKSDIWSLGILLLGLLFGRNPWREATTNDLSFKAFKESPNHALKKIFPTLSWDCLNFLMKALDVDPIKRFDIKEMKLAFSQLDHLFVQDPWPIAPNNNKASFDSAIFSQEGASWYDIAIEDELLQQKQLIEEDDHFVKPDLDEDMFIHDQEKESWWL